MSDGTTYDARVYRTEVYKGKTVTTYHVRWKVGGKLWREGFRTAAQADSFRSALLTAARKGEVFSLATGRPVAWERTKAATTWYEFACLYVDMKWKLASAKYRKDGSAKRFARTDHEEPVPLGDLEFWHVFGTAGRR
jgi:hypothetical protein